MPTTVSTTAQARFPDSVAPSAPVGLSTVSNGEEYVGVFTPQRTIVPAGITPPTLAAVLTDGGAGVLPAGNVAYLFCYASSQYPGVSADTTAGGFLWPKSNPSPVSATYVNPANHRINVTVQTTTRADIDKILIYRTGPSAAVPPDYTKIVAQAGQVFYVGSVNNNTDPAVTSVVFADNVAATQEEMEVDNFPAPQFWLCEYIDPYWYGIGNPDLVLPVSIDGSGNITATGNVFWTGRNGEFVNFDGITTGGFDGRGTFYFKYQSSTVANVSLSADYSSIAFPGYNGTTTMRVRGFAGTLYRSKARNPFAWGYTELIAAAGGAQIRVTQTFSQLIGGYAVAIKAMPQQSLLKIDVERPSTAYVIDTTVDLTSNFNQAKRVIDTRYIVTSHHSQFPCLLSNGQTGLRGFDTSNFAIVQSDSGGQAPVSEEVRETLRLAQSSGDSGRLFHGCFDSRTQLSCFWLKTATDPYNLLTHDTCLLYHGPTGQWSMLRDLDVTASASIYDPVAEQSITLIGTANGQICQAFVPGTWTNIIATTATVASVPAYTFYNGTLNSAGNALNGTYFDLYRDPVHVDRFWFNVGGALPFSPPATPSGGTLRQINTNGFQNSITTVASQIATAMAAAGYLSTGGGTGGVFAGFSPVDGLLPDPSAGTAPVTISAGNLTFPRPTAATGTLTFNLPSLPYPVAGVWALTQNSTGQAEKWMRLASVTPASSSTATVVVDGWYDPYTMTAGAYYVSTTTNQDSTPSGLPGVGDSVRQGIINCEAQTYFQPSEQISSQTAEMWTTQNNVDATQEWVRLYAEFDSAIYQAPFQLKQPTRGSGQPSNNWETCVVPSGLMPQFGVRIIERGYGNFTLLSFTIGRQGT